MEDEEKQNSQRKDNSENSMEIKILKKWDINAAARMLHNDCFYEQTEQEMLLSCFPRNIQQVQNVT